MIYQLWKFGQRKELQTGKPSKTWRQRWTKESLMNPAAFYCKHRLNKLVEKCAKVTCWKMILCKQGCYLNQILKLRNEKSFLYIFRLTTSTSCMTKMWIYRLGNLVRRRSCKLGNHHRSRGRGGPRRALKETAGIWQWMETGETMC